jgi:hypothetical protein
MPPRKIKIVKRDTPIPEPVPVPELQADKDRRTANQVKKWISERQENSLAEKTSGNRHR